MCVIRWSDVCVCRFVPEPAVRTGKVIYFSQGTNLTVSVDVWTVSKGIISSRGHHL